MNKLDKYIILNDDVFLDIFTSRKFEFNRLDYGWEI